MNLKISSSLHPHCPRQGATNQLWVGLNLPSPWEARNQTCSQSQASEHRQPPRSPQWWCPLPITKDTTSRSLKISTSLQWCSSLIMRRIDLNLQRSLMLWWTTATTTTCHSRRPQTSLAPIITLRRAVSSKPWLPWHSQEWISKWHPRAPLSSWNPIYQARRNSRWMRHQPKNKKSSINL